MKKTIWITGLLLIVGLVIAGDSISVTPSSFKPEPKPINTRQTITVTYNCGKDIKTLSFNEPNTDIDDEFEEEVKGTCGQDITNIRDSLGRDYKENVYGLRSFDETKLKEDVCNRMGTEEEPYVYDNSKGTGECVKTDSISINPK